MERKSRAGSRSVKRGKKMARNRFFFHENAKKIAQNMMCLKDTDTFDWQFESPSISLEIWMTDDT